MLSWPRFPQQVFRRFFRRPVSPLKCVKLKHSLIHLAFFLSSAVRNSTFLRHFFFRQLSDAMFTDVFCMSHKLTYHFNIYSKVPLTNQLGPEISPSPKCVPGRACPKRPTIFRYHLRTPSFAKENHLSKLTVAYSTAPPTYPHLFNTACNPKQRSRTQNIPSPKCATDRVRRKHHSRSLANCQAHPLTPIGKKIFQEASTTSYHSPSPAVE